MIGKDKHEKYINKVKISKRMEDFRMKINTFVLSVPRQKRTEKESKKDLLHS